MKLDLLALGVDEVHGIYGVKKDHLPDRMRFLHPAAAASFHQNLAETVTVSDMFRSAEASLQARRERRGAQRPGFSGHNFGFSIDIDVDRTMRTLGTKA